MISVALLLALLTIAVMALPMPPLYDGAIEIEAGHAALEQDDLGLAMWHYQRALTVIPRDPAAQLGAAIVRALRTDILPEESGLWADLTRLTADVMSINELRWLALMSWTGMFLALTAWAIRRPAVSVWRIAVVMMGVTVALMGLLVARQWYESAYPAATLTAFEAFAYAAPDENAPILFKVYSAAEGRILERREGWIRLHLPDGREGWIPQTGINEGATDLADTPS